jgi:hypothetical protein
MSPVGNCLPAEFTLFSEDTFIAWANSVDPNQLVHPCDLIRSYTVCFLVRNNLRTVKANGADPQDQMAQMCQLIWIYTVYPCDKRHIYGEKG